MLSLKKKTKKQKKTKKTTKIKNKTWMPRNGTHNQSKHTYFLVFPYLSKMAWFDKCRIFFRKSGV